MPLCKCLVATHNQFTTTLLYCTDVCILPHQTDKGTESCVEYGTIFSEPLVGMCVAFLDAIGCPLEFIIFPLLTIIAGCMGINAHVAINQMWTEPAIVWFIVAANKGQKKTAALRLLKKPLEEIEEREEQEWRKTLTQTHKSSSNTTPP